jgi:hypothetical protein
LTYKYHFFTYGQWKKFKKKEPVDKDYREVGGVGGYRVIHDGKHYEGVGVFEESMATRA